MRGKAGRSETGDAVVGRGPPRARQPLGRDRGDIERLGLRPGPVRDRAGLELHDLLERVVELDASDLHLTAGAPPVIRVNGGLRALTPYPVLMAVVVQDLVYGMLTHKQRARLEEDLELDLSYTLPGKARFRVNIYVQRGALGAAFRLVPARIKTLEELNLPPELAEFSRLPRGLVLLTGPTGHGKSTTLASMVDIINSERAVHIVTLEDPIEFLHENKKSIINQREVGQDTKSFANALRHVLRQDPDVILVGEMRDLETIAMAITAAETGHLVLATLHTPDAPQAVDRMIDVFPPHQQRQVRVQVADSLMAVIAQQLLPTADGQGRVPAVEVLVCTPAVRNLIREAKGHQIYSAVQAGAGHGMRAMDAALAALVRSGRITAEVAFERCHHRDELSRLFGRAPPNPPRGATAAIRKVEPDPGGALGTRPTTRQRR